MSKDCLVTTLKGSVNNDNLRRLGEIFFSTYQAEEAVADSNYIPIATPVPIEVRVVSGNGYLTDSDLVSNPVKEKTFSNGNISIYFSNHDMVIGVRPKYTMNRIGIGSYTAQYANWGFDLSELAYMNLRELIISRLHVTGDISYLKDCWEENTPSPYYKYMDLWSSATNVHIHGNINQLNGVFVDFGFIRLRFSDQDIYGDIVSYANSNIHYYIQSGTNVFKEISWCKNTKVHGDLSKFDADVLFFDGTNNNNVFSWTTERGGGTILCLNYVNLGNYVKNYLIDNADLELSSSATYKMINISGTVDLTDADVVTAVNKLKTKGLTQFVINGQNMLA